MSALPSPYAQLLGLGLVWVSAHCAGMCGPLLVGLDVAGVRSGRTVVRIQGAAGTRHVAVQDFCIAPGRTTLAADEITFPLASPLRGAPVIRAAVLADPSIVGSTKRIWVVASDDIDMLNKGFIKRDVPEAERVVPDSQIGWFDALAGKGQVKSAFNTVFLSAGDSREPEQAGILGALMGSIFTMLVTVLLVLPLGVMSAIYLEEFAPKNRVTEIIEVNINNLAAVPSIVYGLLGLAVEGLLLHGVRLGSQRHFHGITRPASLLRQVQATAVKPA